MDLDMKLKFNFNKRNRYKNICSIEGCNNRACGKYCNKHYHQIKRYGHIKTRTRLVRYICLGIDCRAVILKQVKHGKK